MKMNKLWEKKVNLQNESLIKSIHRFISCETNNHLEKYPEKENYM